MATSNTSTCITGPDQLPTELNFRILKQLGLDAIIESGSKYWTDFNEHDPGVTILELLTLIATDLSYRCKFPIEDILTIGPNQGQTANFFPDQFYTAAEILSSSPVTETDFCKSFVDLAGIANAWVRPLPPERTPIHGLVDIILSPDEELQTQIAPFLSFRTELSTTEIKALKKDLQSIRNLDSGQTLPMPSSLISLLVSLWNLPPNCAADLNIALDAYFHVFPEQIQEIPLYLTPMLLPQGIDGGSRSERRHSLYALFDSLFFSARLPDDHWLPVPLRGVLEQIESAAATYHSTLQQAQLHYAAQRPLCSDLHQITLLEPLPVLFKIDLKLSPGADPAGTLASVLFTLKQCLSCPTSFLSLDAMMEACEHLTNDVFNGPGLQHGFIEDSALKPRVPYLLSSSLADAIRHLPGVLSIEDLCFGFSYNDRPIPASEWTSAAVVPRDRALHLGPILENQFNISTSEEALRYAYDSLLFSEPSAKLSPRSRDLPIPKGEFRSTATYRTVQEDFPRIYELQPYGPSSPEPTRERLAEIRQLQAYLLIFDQILADYFTQLSCLGQLYSWSPDVTHTRFFQGLEKVVDQLGELVDLPQYASQTPQLVEDVPAFETRRNQYLEQLLRRFGRDLSQDLAALVTENDSAAVSIDRRQQFLANYPSLSSKRGTGQNFLSPQASLHLSGLVQTLNSLAGFRPLDKENKIFLSQFSQANLGELSELGAWMPRYALTDCKMNPLDFRKVLSIGANPKNYRLDRHNQTLAKEEQEEWLGMDLIVKKLARDRDLTTLIQEQSPRNTLLIALYNNTHFFRVYNHSGQCSLSLSSLQLNHVESELKDLDKTLKPYWQGQSIPADVKTNITSQVIFLVQQTHRLILAGTLSDGTFLEPCQLNQTFANDAGAAPVIASLSQLFQKFNQLSQQVTLVEHSLMRPADSATQFHLSLVDHNGQVWAKSDQPSSLTNIQQLDSTGCSMLLWSVTKNAQTHYYQTECLPPFNTTPLCQTPTDPLWIEFEVQDPSSPSGLFTIQSQFGHPNHRVYLSSQSGFDSSDDASQQIQQWLSHAAAQAQHKQAAWITTLEPLHLSDAQHQALPHFLQQDPYSSIATAILPSWPERFQDLNYRETLTQVLQREAPAHLYLNILWVDLQWFQRFHSLHESWLALYQVESTPANLLAASSRPILEHILHETARQYNGRTAPD